MSDAPHAHNPVPRFAIVGCANFCVSFLVFYLCYRFLPFGKLALAIGAGSSGGWLPGLHVEGAVSNVLAYLAGMINSFALNRSWTFRASRNHAGAQAVRFVAVNLFSLTLGTLTVYHFVDVQGYPELAVWIPLTLVIMVVNYLGCRHWAFAAPTLQSSESP